jgi:hypothetical protein
MGTKIKDAMGYYRFVLAFFIVYTLLCQIGTINMFRNFGIRDSAGGINIIFVQFALSWVVLLVPFFFKPIDMITNFKLYIKSFFVYYFSYSWWFICLNIYSMCNLDDVTWGNRPNNKTNGMNAYVDSEKRHEILKQSYRLHRTNMVIWWMLVNIIFMCIIDSLVLSAVHNHNVELKRSCMNILLGYSYYSVFIQMMVMLLAGQHNI